MKGQGQGQVGERNERKEKKTKQGNLSVYKKNVFFFFITLDASKKVVILR